MSKIVVTGRELQLSPGCRKLNPHLCSEPQDKDLYLREPDDPKDPTRKRIRQNTKPLSNKLETEFGQWLRQSVADREDALVYEQGITVRLANGVKYTPDWVVSFGLATICYEVKGKRMWDDSIVKLKMAAKVFPRWTWYLAWKEEGQWMLQTVVA